MINNVVLVGRLTRDPELRYTPSNVAVATFSLAVNRNFKNQAGDYEADFISCIMWRQQAENFANWLKKGALVGITGRIQTRSYDNQQGQRVYVTEVVAESFQILEKRIMLQTMQVWKIKFRQVLKKLTLWIYLMMIYHSNIQENEV